MFFPSLSSLDCATFAQVLARRAAETPDNHAFTYLENGDRIGRSWTYAQLAERADAVAARLQGAYPEGSRVLLLFPQGLDFVAAFFGCLQAGMVAVPAYPPRANHHFRRLSAIVADCDASAILTTEAQCDSANRRLHDPKSNQPLETIAVDRLPNRRTSTRIQPDDGQRLAFLQYTSGSTGDPKGVMVSHRNLWINCASLDRTEPLGPGDAILSWLPAFHDMGLIYGILVPVFKGVPSFLMAPVAFLMRPARWLAAMARHKATHTAAPNFAFDLARQKTTEAERAELDLGHVRLMLNGAEPIRPDTLDLFAEAFAVSGLRREALSPGYGLAEHTLKVTASRGSEPPRHMALEAESLGEGRIVPAPGKSSAIQVVDCGQLDQDTHVVIVDPDSQRRREPGHIGEIWLQSPSVALGYWNRPDQSEAVFAAKMAGGDPNPFLRTGDLGFLHENRLFITGRLKELIIVEGRNLYPRDLEHTAEEAHDDLKRNGSAAFAVETARGERPVLAMEIKREARRDPEIDAIFAAVSLAIREHHGVELHAAVLLRPGGLPKTSSGKIQRRACARSFQEGDLKVIASHLFEEDDMPAATSEIDGTALRAVPSERRAEWVRAWLVRYLRTRTGLPEHALEPDTPLAVWLPDSLAVLKLNHAIQRDLELTADAMLCRGDLTLEQLVTTLTSALEDRNAPAPEDMEMAREPQAARELIPLSANQEALWYLHRLQPNTTAYHLRTALVLHAPADPARVRAVLERIQRRHPMLRAVFEGQGGKAGYRLPECQPLPLSEILLDPSRERAPSTWLDRMQPHLDAPLIRPDKPAWDCLVLTGLPDRTPILFRFHHLITDFWSIALFLDEFSQAYATSPDTLTERAGDPERLRRQQAAYLDGPRARADAQFWREHLRDAPSHLPIPHDSPESGSDASATTVPVAFSPEVSKAIADLAQACRTTGFTVIMAAYHLWLQRLAQGDDTVVGTPNHCRYDLRRAHTFSYLVNPLPIRIRGNHRTGFRHWVEQVREVMGQALTHGDYPFNRVVADVAPERNVNETPVFQAMLVFQNPPLHAELSTLAFTGRTSEFALHGLSFSSLPLPSPPPPIDLTLDLAFSEGTWVGELACSPRRFLPQTARRFAAWFGTLLEAAVREPARVVTSLPLIDSATREMLLRDWNHSGPVLKPVAAIHHFIERQARAIPHRIALETVTDENGNAFVSQPLTLSYDAWNRASNQAARYLRGLGIRREDRVGVLVARESIWQVATLGIWKAGAIYVPLDPDYPSDRLNHLIAHSRPRILIDLHGSLETSALSIPDGVVVIGRAQLEREIRRQEDRDLDLEILSGQGAALIYTSGSTGRPKGALLQHDAIVNIMAGMIDLVPADDDTRLAQIMSPSFDFSLIEWAYSVGRGGCLLLGLPQPFWPDGEALERFRHWGVTTLTVSPSFIAQLPPRPWPALRLLVCGGEPTSAQLARTWADDRMYLNIYGPAECTLFATSAEIRPDGRRPDLGFIMPGASLYLLDAALAPVAPGQIGEIYLGGISVSRGYFDQPGLTADRFVPDPFADGGEDRPAGGRLYRTGDLARFLPDGRLDFHRRIDHQIKLRGYRIEPGEIEHHLDSHPATGESLVAAEWASGIPKRLLAWIRLAEGISEPPSSDALRHYLSQHLPEYMVPARIWVRDSFPRTPNNKVDRQALLDSVRTGSDARGATAHLDDEPPSGRAEETLARMWADLVPGPAVTRASHFFQRGGHSLDAVTLAARIENEIGRSVPVAALIEEPTLAGMAAALKRVHPACFELSQDPESHGSGPHPLSNGQLSLWFHQQIATVPHLYHVPVAFHLHGPLDRGRFVRTFSALVQRHAMLRARFRPDAEEPTQTIEEDVVANLHFETIPPDRWKSHFEQAVERPFDLRVEAPIRASLFQLTPDHHLFVLVAHHLVSDGHSMGVLLREWSRLYDTAAEGSTPAEPSLPPLPYEYPAFARAERAWWNPTRLGPALDFWDRYLDRAPTLNLPTDHRTPSVPDFKAETICFTLPETTDSAIGRLCSQAKVTPFAVLFGACHTWLAQLCGQRDFVIATPVTLRSTKDLEHMVGHLVNMLPIRLDASPYRRFCDVLEAAAHRVHEALAHREVPFRLIATNRNRKTSWNPVFRVMFSYENFPAHRLDLDGLEARLQPLEVDVAKFDLGITITHRNDRMACRVTFNRDLFSPEKRAALAMDFQATLERLLTEPDLELDVSPAAERAVESEGIAPMRGSCPEPRPGVSDGMCGELRRMFGEVLERDAIGEFDDFFELGGHSLNGTRLLNRIRDHFGIHLTLRDFFLHPSPRPLADLLAERLTSASHEGACESAIGEVSPQAAPLSYPQRRLWFLEQLRGQGPLYYLAGSMRLTGDLDASALWAALSAVVERHEILRTTYRSRNGEPIQSVQSATTLAPKVIDLTHLDPEGAEREAERLIQGELSQPIDLGADPTMRALLIESCPRRYHLSIVLHHIAGDGWSIPILFADLETAYNAAVAGRTAQLPALPLQYRHFAARQRTWIESGRFDGQLAFWRRTLAAPPDLLHFAIEPWQTGSGPTATDPTATGEDQGSEYTLDIPPQLAEAWERKSRERHLTPFMAYLAATAVLLSRLTDRYDFCIGTQIANRQYEGTENLIGFFSNTLALRMRVGATEDLDTWFSTVRDTCLDAFAHQDYPFDLLIEKLGLGGDPNGNPFFNVVFAYQEELQPPRLDHLDVALRETQLNRAKFDLTFLLVHLRDGTRRLVLDYRSASFGEACIAAMARQFTLLLERLTGEPEAPVRRVDLTTPEERTKLLHRWPEGKTSGPGAPSLIHQTFVDIARAQPDRPALVNVGRHPEDRDMTYGQLEAWSAAIARDLRAHGVGPEIPVAVFAEHEAAAYASVLGIWRAGGIYLPLDPEFPPERLQFMISEVVPKVIIARAGLQLPVDVEVPRLDPGRPPEPGTQVELSTSPLDPDHLAYIIYTSGSTGRPKGTMLTYGGLARVPRTVIEDLEITAEDRVLHLSSFSFDASIFDMVFAFCSGAALCHTSHDERLPGPPLAESLRRGRITFAIAPNSIWAATPEDNLPDLRLIGSGGEASTPQVVARWMRTCPVINLYGPTETTVDATLHVLRERDLARIPPIGRPVSGVLVRVLDSELQLVPPGQPGELFIGGAGVGRGYLGRPGLTAEKFIPDPHASKPGSRLYRTGDKVVWSDEGHLIFIARLDHQVKLRGFRIELHEIAAVLRRHPAINDALALVHRAQDNPESLHAFVTLDPSYGGPAPREQALRDFTTQRLPHFMVPQHLHVIDAFPLLHSGKTDRAALLARLDRPAANDVPRDPQPSPIPRQPRVQPLDAILALWGELLEREPDPQANFFDLGGHSLLLLRLRDLIAERHGIELDLIELFRHPTPVGQANLLQSQWPTSIATVPEETHRVRETASRETRSDDVALIGMALRVPGADSPEAFWDNLKRGLCSIRDLTPQEREALDPELREDPDHVARVADLPHIDRFDADLFGMSPMEARVTDPQQRLLLELAWEALERAGYPAGTGQGDVGVFAGTGWPDYLTRHLLNNREAWRTMGDYQMSLAVEKDFAATRIAYKLNLKGTSLTVQTACSTSLVAVHLAREALLRGDCDLALAGGATLHMPPARGYLYQEGMILSPDGKCRAFDAEARGTIPGDGAAFVVLKKLDDALRDGDPIHAIVKSSATNNDGAHKVGFTAPSVDGQSEVIEQALRSGGISPESIGYVEAHGTGTPLGDPIEVQALTRAWRKFTDKRGFCALGSVKTNIGHLDTAAGVVGLIKAALAVKHGAVPPSLHFQTPNPHIDFDSGPFRVADRLRDWSASARRAAVSSFGIGGTNAHVILESPPGDRHPTGQRRSERVRHPLVVSAKSEGDLKIAAQRLLDHLHEVPEGRLGDVAWTLAAGRKPFPHRLAVHAADGEEARERLGRAAENPPPRSPAQTPVVALFPGQGTQFPGMGLPFRGDPVFDETIDHCADILHAALGFDLRDPLYADPNDPETAHLWDERLAQTRVGQPILFSFEIALARAWRQRGLRVDFAVGHSLGEWVAATFAEVFALEDALRLVALRGRLMGDAPAGAMLAIGRGAAATRALLRTHCSTGDVAIAAENGPDQTVVSGPSASIAHLQDEWREAGEKVRIVQSHHAFHSASMAGAMEPLARAIAAVTRREPAMPFLSCVTGMPITPEQAVDPDYWARQLRGPVLMADGLASVPGAQQAVWLELGPRRTLSGLVAANIGQDAVSRTRQVMDRDGAATDPAPIAARLWEAGARWDWPAWFGSEYRKLELPTYPFDRASHWIEPVRESPRRQVPAVRAPVDRSPDPAGTNLAKSASHSRRLPITDWFHAPSWRRLAVARTVEAPRPTPDHGDALVFGDEGGLIEALCARLEGAGTRTVRVQRGDRFRRLGGDRYQVNPASFEDFEALSRELGSLPRGCFYLWPMQMDASSSPQEWEAVCFGALAALARWYAKERGDREYRLLAGADSLADPFGAPPVPEKSLLRGPLAALANEFPQLGCALIDIGMGTPHEKSVDLLVREWIEPNSTSLPSPAVLALRGAHVWQESFEPLPTKPDPAHRARIRRGGVYLITGGTGGMGLTLATHLAECGAGVLVLCSRSGDTTTGTQVPVTIPGEAVAREAAERRALLEHLRDLEIELLIETLDIADRGEVTRLRDRLLARFGAVHGIVHAAGVPGNGLLARMEPDAWQSVFAPKVEGTRLVHELFAGPELDFLLLCGSLISATGTFGQADYLAANAFQDAFAEAASARGTQVLSIGWDMWLSIGMATRSPLQHMTGSRPSPYGIEPAEGPEVVARALSTGMARLLVVTHPSKFRPFDVQWDTGSSSVEIRQGQAPSDPSDLPSPERSPEESPGEEPVRNGSHGHPRPRIETPFVAPRDELEAALAEIWRAALGLAEVGVEDHLFELGGNSLLALQILAEIRDQLGVNLPQAAFFDQLTIAGIAVRLRIERDESVCHMEEEAEPAVPLPHSRDDYFEEGEL
ncbi:Amino acid adenylation domain-containing protein [Sulfidibacter corallicola]|uniref:Amino acid adenylation domain-containing protein n=1 Tax=Sulfidibacter corallicola TaxID=2818388 RepID=A0A8A4TF44_SULCO|nr:non-ribosomal peptide synthetase/type I polyketide synthase [Sulfidibacter corallicola]QTD48160.1 amino acid adenylation domain-containing protein [Sulfidibacter corallicola]